MEELTIEYQDKLIKMLESEDCELNFLALIIVAALEKPTVFINFYSSKNRLANLDGRPFNFAVREFAKEYWWHNLYKNNKDHSPLILNLNKTIQFVEDYKDTLYKLIKY